VSDAVLDFLLQLCWNILAEDALSFSGRRYRDILPQSGVVSHIGEAHFAVEL
jgi:hypothetical protein